jgi:hypothetical protein
MVRILFIKITISFTKDAAKGTTIIYALLKNNNKNKIRENV